MNKISQYFLKKYFLNFIGVASFLVFLIILIRLTGTLDDVLRYQGSNIDIAIYLVTLTPGGIHDNLAVLLFLSSALIITVLRITNETTPLRAAGFSLWQITRSILICLLIFATLWPVLADLLVYPANLINYNTYQKIISADKTTLQTKKQSAYLTLPDLLCHFSNLDIAQHRSEETHCMLKLDNLKNPFSATIFVLASRSSINPPRLVLHSAKLYTLGKNQLVSKIESKKEYSWNIQNLENFLSSHPEYIEHSKFSDLHRHRQFASLSGRSTHPVNLEIFRRLFFPLFLFGSGYLGLVFGFYFTKPGISAAIGISVLFKLTLLIFAGLLQFISGKGYVSPIITAAFPAFILPSLAFYLQRRLGL